MTHSHAQQSVLVTGAGGGLGSALAHYAVARGWHVYAADINTAALTTAFGSNPNITPIVMDVSNTESVKQAAAKVASLTDSLSAVVNFAGILRTGMLVEMDEAAMQQILDINVMGTFRVNQAFFPLVLAGKGRIINISSETGWQSGQPFNGPYGASKHAIEGYSDSLRRELMLLDIPVIKIQPGPFKTNMTASIEKNFDAMAATSHHFADAITIAKHRAIQADTTASDPDILAAAVYKAMTTPRPKAAYSVRPDMSRLIMNALPSWLSDTIIKKFLTK